MGIATELPSSKIGRHRINDANEESSSASKFVMSYKLIMEYGVKE